MDLAAATTSVPLQNYACLFGCGGRPDLVERRDAERLWGRAAWVRRGRLARFATAVAIRCPRDEEGDVEEGVVVEQADELEPDEVRA